jgi:hypothetical protein
MTFRICSANDSSFVLSAITTALLLCPVPCMLMLLLQLDELVVVIHRLSQSQCCMPAEEVLSLCLHSCCLVTCLVHVANQ